MVTYDEEMFQMVAVALVVIGNPGALALVSDQVLDDGDGEVDHPLELHEVHVVPIEEAIRRGD